MEARLGPVRARRSKTARGVGNAESHEGFRFWGKVEDINGMPGIGQIEGVLEGEKIKFTKLMPEAYAATDTGELIKLSGKHPAIQYSGTYNRSLDRFEGVWKIGWGIRFYGISPVLMGSASGTWNMKLHTQSPIL